MRMLGVVSLGVQSLNKAAGQQARAGVIISSSCPQQLRNNTPVSAGDADPFEVKSHHRVQGENVPAEGCCTSTGGDHEDWKQRQSLSDKLGASEPITYPLLCGFVICKICTHQFYLLLSQFIHSPHK